jgi:glycosyltransferase involved in cell wall biosynthesis
VVYLPYGVDLNMFNRADLARAPPQFVAVGRFVEKKAPHLLILAFARVLEARPNARLTMIGDGPLAPLCRQMVLSMGLADRIALPGARPHAFVAATMTMSRAFVQHSIEANNGDCEGTPNSIIEALSAALPVVATRHAGIRRIEHGSTGLVDELTSRRWRST